MSGNHGVKPGDEAPEVYFVDTTGEMVSLRRLMGPKWLVLFFYPRDETLLCTREACRFRDAYDEFRKLGAEVVGVSDDTAMAHTQFAADYQLPYSLVTDPGGLARERFGTGKTLGIMPGRATYLIDNKGVVRHVFSARFQPGRHVDEALSAIRALDDGKENSSRVMADGG